MPAPVVYGFDALGVVLVLFGAYRLIGAPALAAGRASRAAAAVSGAPPDRQRYIRGLTDFYRITGCLLGFAGIVLILVLNLAR